MPHTAPLCRANVQTPANVSTTQLPDVCPNSCPSSKREMKARNKEEPSGAIYRTVHELHATGHSRLPLHQISRSMPCPCNMLLRQRARRMHLPAHGGCSYGCSFGCSLRWTVQCLNSSYCDSRPLGGVQPFYTRQLWWVEVNGKSENFLIMRYRKCCYITCSSAIWRIAESLKYCGTVLS